MIDFVIRLCALTNYKEVSLIKYNKISSYVKNKKGGIVK